MSITYPAVFTGSQRNAAPNGSFKKWKLFINSTRPTHIEKALLDTQAGLFVWNNSTRNCQAKATIYSPMKYTPIRRPTPYFRRANTCAFISFLLNFARY
jgi:hypothetical protein